MGNGITSSVVGAASYPSNAQASGHAPWLMSGLKWGTSELGLGMTLTYSFGSEASAFAPGYGLADGRYAMNAQQQAVARAAIQRVDEVCGLEFVEVVETSNSVGDVRWTNTTVSMTNGGGAHYPSTAAYGGDIWLSSTVFHTPRPGNYAYACFIHELGHAVGLKHPHETVGGPVGDLSRDAAKYSVMSYRDHVGDNTSSWGASWFPTSLMVDDIRALQALYGADTTHRTGDDVYRYAAAQPVLETLWDAGGIDTIDASADLYGVRIDLTPGAYSSIGAYYHDTSALVRQGLGIAFGCDIEHAIGSALADVLIGNTLDNHLRGGDGGDTLHGGEGNDTLDAGTGPREILDGGSGHDLLIGTGPSVFLEGGPGDDTYLVGRGAVVIEQFGNGRDRVRVETDSLYQLPDAVEVLEIQGLGGATALGIGTVANDELRGESAVLQGGGGNDHLHGRVGTAETAAFSGSFDGYTLRRVLLADGGEGWRVHDRQASDGDEGADLLDAGIDRIQFGDGLSVTLAPQTRLSQNGGMFGVAAARGDAAGTVVAWRGQEAGFHVQRLGEHGGLIGSPAMPSFSGSNVATFAIDVRNDGQVAMAWLRDPASLGRQIDALVVDPRTGATTSLEVADLFDAPHDLPGADLGGTVVALDTGGELIVWEHASLEGLSVHAQAFGADHTPGPAVRLGTTVSDQRTPAAARLGDGSIAVVWRSDSGTIEGTILGRGGQFTGTTFTVASPVEGSGDDTVRRAPEVAAVAHAGFVVTWAEGPTEDSAVWQIVGQLHGQPTVGGGVRPRGDVISIATLRSEGLILPTTSVSGLPDGGFVTTWQETDGDRINVMSVRHDALGEAIGLPQQLNVLGTYGTAAPQVAPLENGGHVVTWIDDSLHARLQLFDAEGHAALGAVDGTPGADTFDAAQPGWVYRGGSGDDLYVARSAGQRIIELADPSGGIDTVRTQLDWALADGLEQLSLVGYGNVHGLGNAGANRITGNHGRNVIVGFEGDDSLTGGLNNDTLDGGGGQDTLIGGPGLDQTSGGPGDDLYVVDHAGDRVIEQAGGGVDVIRTTVDWTLPPEVETLILNTGARTGRGNDGANTLIGNGSGNTMRGEAGADLLDGSGGPDVLEGDQGDDTLLGGSGNDTLTGGTGSDFINGGSGRDAFRFTSIPSPANGVDTVVDFVSGTDQLQFDAAVFRSLGAVGRLSSADFVQGTSALDASDRLIHDITSGRLLYDPDGLGGQVAVWVATLAGSAPLVSSDLWVV